MLLNIRWRIRITVLKIYVLLIVTGVRLRLISRQTLDAAPLPEREAVKG